MHPRAQGVAKHLISTLTELHKFSRELSKAKAVKGRHLIDRALKKNLLFSDEINVKFFNQIQDLLINWLIPSI